MDTDLMVLGTRRMLRICMIAINMQMRLPPLYYSGRENPPHPEIWINNFLRMIELYSKKVYDLSINVQEKKIDGNLS